MRTIYITLLIILPQMISSRTIFVAEEGSLYRKGLLHIESVSYIRFENIMVRNSRNVGIYVKGPGTANIELVNCKTDDTYNSGIGIWYADSVLVKGCEITRANNQDMRPEGFPLRREAPHEALTLAGATNFTVTENHIHSCYKEGIDCKEVSSHGVIFNNYIHDLPRQGLYVDCWFGMLENVEIYSNIVHDCEWGAAISGEGKDAKMKNIRLHHNILYNNRASGILFGVWGHAFNGESPLMELPMYENPWKADFRLKNCSVAIGAGIAIEGYGAKDLGAVPFKEEDITRTPSFLQNREDE